MFVSGIPYFSAMARARDAEAMANAAVSPGHADPSSTGVVLPHEVFDETHGPQLRSTRRVFAGYAGVGVTEHEF